MLLIASGCSGLVGGPAPTGDTPDPATSGTVTPVPVPTDRASLPPGVTETGLADPAALTVANERAIETTAHRLRRSLQVGGGNGTLVIERVQRRSADARLRSTLTVMGDGPVSPVVDARTRYREAEIVYERATLSDGRQVTNRLPARKPGTVLFGARLPTRLFTHARFDVAGRDDGDVVLRSRTRFELPDGLRLLSTDIERASVQAIVTGDGLVRSLTIEGVVRTADGRVPVRLTQTVTTGPVVVDRPAWVRRVTPADTDSG